MEHGSQANRTQHEGALTGFDSCELQNLFDHLRQPAALVAHEIAVLANLRFVFDDTVGKVLGGRANHGEWRTQLV